MEPEQQEQDPVEVEEETESIPSEFTPEEWAQIQEINNMVFEEDLEPPYEPNELDFEDGGFDLAGEI